MSPSARPAILAAASGDSGQPSAAATCCRTCAHKQRREGDEELRIASALDLRLQTSDWAAGWTLLEKMLHCSTAQARTAALLKNRRQHCCSTDLQGGLQHCSSNNRTSRNVTGASKKAPLSGGKEVRPRRQVTGRYIWRRAGPSGYNAVHAHLDDAVCGDGVEVEQRGTSRVKGGHYI
eukprot:scaffold289753_cov17-Tisochrysis_lutea.AAC.1